MTRVAKSHPRRYRLLAGLTFGTVLAAVALGAWSWSLRSDGFDGSTVLKKNADGTWVVPWSTIQTYIGTLTPREDLGEKNHHLLPDEPQSTAYATIIPYVETEGNTLKALQQGLIIAKIVASADYPRLRLKKGDNYFGIFRTKWFKRWRPVVFQPSYDTREVMPRFRYLAGDRNPQFVRARLSASAYDCAVNKKLKACFVDSRQFHVAPAVPPSDANASWAGGLWIRLRRWFRDGNESQPWVACPDFGCCCGGSNCHPT